MKHKWEQQPNENILAVGWHKVWICRICGCKKIHGCYRFSEPSYSRNKQNYDRYIECIDIEAENLKTID